MSQRTLYARLGEQIDHLIRALALERGWSRGETMTEVAERTEYDESTVYRWRQGRLCPPDEILEELASIGREEAGLDRFWGEDLFEAAGYTEEEARQLAESIWGLEDVELRDVPNNLPTPAHTQFIGKREELKRLLRLLSFHVGANFISVDGIGGVGKTTLVLEAAYRCLRASTGEAPSPRVPTFDAIIFASAKQQLLTTRGIRTRHQNVLRTLRHLFHEIAETLDQRKITQAAPEDQRELVAETLGRQPTLLIVDNLETIDEEERDQLLDFLMFELPPQVKIVVTTRERVATRSAIRLEALSETESLQLLAHEAREQDVPLSEAQMKDLYRRLGGVPAALIYAVGQIATGSSLKYILERTTHGDGDIARFCFEGSVEPLRGEPAHDLLMTIAMFPKRPLREAIAATAGLAADPIAVEQGLARLQQLSLVNRREERYGMLPLTREYALAELAAHPAFEEEARQRWVSWYREFVREYGGEEGKEWQIQYDHLEEEWENLLAVFEWCAAGERYEALRELWSRKGVRAFSNLYGYWDERLYWSDWLIQAAERRGDWITAVRATYGKAWMLVMMSRPEQLEEAYTLLLQAWDLRDQTGPDPQLDIAHAIAYLHIRRQQYAEVQRWFDEEETLLEEATLEGYEHNRQKVAIMYWRAAVAYETGDYENARRLFEKIIDQSRVIGWQRAVIYAQNWLADIAILDDELKEADQLLQTGLPVAERNKDKRRIAYYKHSHAKLEKQRDNPDEARRWAEDALDGFERLGMQPEVNQVLDLLTDLDADDS